MQTWRPWASESRATPKVSHKFQGKQTPSALHRFVPLPLHRNQKRKVRISTSGVGLAESLGLAAATKDMERLIKEIATEMSVKDEEANQWIETLKAEGYDSLEALADLELEEWKLMVCFFQE